jgi:phospholipid/cholesterol/gamma-HCH transport system substrate-binding protein
MILSRLIRNQLIAFTIASLIGSYVLAVYFMHVPELLGIGRYPVTVQFRQGAGLYPDAQVNYLGTPVGSVASMALTPTGISVELSLKDGTRIPDDVRAEIHSVSAVGEQYVELVPNPGSAAVPLAAGSQIPVSRTSVPVEIGPVLDNVSKLVNSLPSKQLSALLHETSQSLTGRSQDLQSILDGTHTFLKAADNSFPATQKLLVDAEPLLTTINASGGHIASLTSKLAQVTDELRAGDADLRSLLSNGPAFTTQTSGLFDDLGSSLPGLLMPLGTVTGVLATYKDYLAQLLTDYPTALSLVQSVTLPDAGIGAVRLTVSQANKPPECTEGFLPVNKWRLPEVTGPAYTPLYYCSAAANDSRVVRGARNVPCPNNPGRLEPTPSKCREK